MRKALLAAGMITAAVIAEEGSAGHGLLGRLRADPSTRTVKGQLDQHAFVFAAAGGRLTLKARQAFAAEQYGVPFFCANPKIPPTVVEDTAGSAELFQYLTGAEKFAGPLLLDYATALGMTEEDLQAWHKSTATQSFQSYFARLAFGGKHAAAAAACAIAFPPHARMYRRFSASLASESSYGYSGPTDKALRFVNFFAFPNETRLDEIAAAVIDREGATFDQLVEPVRLAQQYSLAFWDSFAPGVTGYAAEKAEVLPLASTEADASDNVTFTAREIEMSSDATAVADSENKDLEKDEM